METTSATKIDGNDGNVTPVAAEITTSSQQAAATAEKADIESAPQAVDQHSSVMASTAPDAPVVQTEVPPEPPKSDPPSAASTPAAVETPASETIQKEEAAVINPEEQTSPPLPEVRVDDVVKQDSAFDADRIIEEVTAEGIKLAADIIRANPVAAESPSEPAAPTPDPSAESCPTPEPTADPLPSVVSPPADSVAAVPAEASVTDQPQAEEVKQEEPAVQQVVKSAEQVAEDQSLLIDSSASAAETSAILSDKEPEAPVPVDQPASEVPAVATPETQPTTEEPAVAASEPEKAEKSVEEKTAERQSLIDSAATTAVTNGILLQASESKESVEKPEAVEAEGENKEADSAPADPVPKADIPSETGAPESEPVAAVVDAIVPNGEVKVNGESVEPVHENNNAKGESESVPAAVAEVPATAVEA